MAMNRSNVIKLTSGLSTSSGRPIPKRGQVKLAIVAGLAQTLAAAISSLTSRRTEVIC